MMMKKPSLLGPDMWCYRSCLRFFLVCFAARWQRVFFFY